MASGVSKILRSILDAAAAELLLELLNATRRIDEALFPGVGRMRVRSDVANNHEVVNAVDFFDLLAFHCRARDKACACGNVDKAYGFVVWVDFVFHSLSLKLSLLRLEARVCLVNYIYATLATHNLAVGVAGLQRLD